MCSPLIHSLWHNKNFKIFLSHTKLLSLSLCCRAAGDGENIQKLFSLSQSFFSLLSNLPSQTKVVSTQLQTGYNGSQRVTTGPNGLKRVPSQRVQTGLRGGGRRKGQWHVYYLPTIILFISFIQKNFISLFIFLLSLSLK